MLMHQLQGWIEGMRSDLEFFAVDQLLLHAEALLDLLAEHEPLSSASEQHNRVFGYCKAMLQLELGKCYWARGDATGSVQMSKAAVETLQTLPTNPLTTMLAIEAVSSAVVDLRTPANQLNTSFHSPLLQWLSSRPLMSLRPPTGFADSCLKGLNQFEHF